MHTISMKGTLIFVTTPQQKLLSDDPPSNEVQSHSAHCLVAVAELAAATQVPLGALGRPIRPRGVAESPSRLGANRPRSGPIGDGVDLGVAVGSGLMTSGENVAELSSLKCADEAVTASSRCRQRYFIYPTKRGV